MCSVLYLQDSPRGKLVAKQVGSSQTALVEVNE